MRARGMFGSLVVAMAAMLAIQFLPSGAGQHFGFLGDYLHTGPSAAAAGPGAIEVRLSVLSGVAVDASGEDQVPSPRTATLQGFVSITTGAGTDEGCLTSDDLGGPPVVGAIAADPTLQHTHLSATIPSTTYPGAFITIDLTFDGSGNLQPEAPIHADPNDPVTITGRAGLARAAIVSGQVVSSTVGGGGLSSTGLAARGAQVAVTNRQGCAASSL